VRRPRPGLRLLRRRRQPAGQRQLAPRRRRPEAPGPGRLCRAEPARRATTRCVHPVRPDVSRGCCSPGEPGLIRQLRDLGPVRNPGAATLSVRPGATICQWWAQFEFADEKRHTAAT
jgi:hypothetical protein